MSEKKHVVPKAPDTVLLGKAAAIASNVTGFPCEIVVIHDTKTGDIIGYRVQPELEVVMANIMVHHHLKKFALWYMQAHQQSSGMENLKVFSDLISAVFDFGGYWDAFKALEPIESDMVLQMCKRANQMAAAEIAQRMERDKIQKNN